MSAIPEDSGPAPAESTHAASTHAATEVNRRDLFSNVSRIAMAAGLVAGYGTAGVMAGRFLYPASETKVRLMFVCTVDRLARGESLIFVTPVGERVTVARQGGGVSTEDFVALSSTCPHLGCQVHWEGANQRFFCPCHNGAFDAAGTATEGPPADAKTDLPRYPLKVEGTMLFMEVPVEGLTVNVAYVEDSAAPEGPASNDREAL